MTAPSPGTLWWPPQRLGEALQALAAVAGLPLAADAARPGPASVMTGVDAEGLDEAAARLGLEVEAVQTPVPALATLLRGGGPALLRCHDPVRGDGVLLLLPGGRGRLRLLGADGRVQRCTAEQLRAVLCHEHEAPLQAEIDALLRAAAVPPRRQAAVRAALLRDRLSATPLQAGWLLRLPPHAGVWAQLRHAALPQRVAGMLVVFAALYALEIAGWALIGEGVLDGRLDMGWLSAWLLLFVAMLPLQLLGGWFNASFALGSARLLKARLLAGALRMDPDTVRSQGVGGLLGRVIESQALESLVLGGGLAVLVALLEMAFAAWVLAQGAAPLLHAVLLGVWLLLTLVLVARWWHRLHDWTLARLALTHELIEQMVGHRTRLAQEDAARRDVHDDSALHGYLQRSAAMDAANVPLQALLPPGWIVLALAALAPAFAGGSAPPAAWAISLGGILLAQRALLGMAGGLSSLGRAAIAWQQVAALFKAGGRAPDPGVAVPAATADGPLVDAQGLRFAHAGGDPVLQALDLRIGAHDRLLLQGPSGGGKSTLAALLTGLRRPQAGLLLLQGLDAPTLGPQWHALATTAPQFHENHVLSGSVAFNLLMGRQWPAGPEALAEAQALCQELGLGPLLQRMPGGLHQRIGETGWQLSHGERSRLFLARALLQRAPLTVLDESFAALDPETLVRCLRTAQRHTRALLVIAHP